MQNKHGLQRYIPEPIRRQVRQECGFGCVICGSAIVQYEHIDPPFAEARSHYANCIALLCGTCHDRVTRGILSKETIVEARTHPITFQRRFSKDAFDLCGPFQLKVGSNYFENVRSIVRRGRDDEWFVVEEPEVPTGPARISAKFFDESGKCGLEIVRNEWICPTEVWDCVVKGSTVEIRQRKSRTVLRIRTMAPNLFAIVRLNMKLNDIGIEIDTKGIVTFTQNSTRIEMEASQAKAVGTVFQLS